MEDFEIITVRIFGNEYKIKGDSSPEYIKKIADYVDLKMKELKEIGTSTDKIPILVALSIADEYFKLRDTLQTKVVNLTDTLKKSFEGM